jgi:PAS domain S-box-containing protein
MSGAVPKAHERRQKNLVLILARELASKIATATFVADAEGNLVYYNEAAEKILGRTFAEAGEMPATEWAQLFEVEELDGGAMPLERMPAGIALLERRPAHHSFRIAGLDGAKREISVTAVPLLARTDDLVGVVAIFWEPRAG